MPTAGSGGGGRRLCSGAAGFHKVQIEVSGGARGEGGGGGRGPDLAQ